MSRSGQQKAWDPQKALVLVHMTKRQAAPKDGLRAMLAALEERPGTNGPIKIGLALPPAWLAQSDVPERGKMLQELQRQGAVEMIAYPLTEPFLPLLRTEEAVYAQLAAAVREHERCFGMKPRGIVLPGGGFTPGIDRLLRELGVDYAVVGANTVAHAAPAADGAGREAILTPYGVVLLPAEKPIDATTDDADSAIARASGSKGVIVAQIGNAAALEPWLRQLGERGGEWGTPAELVDAAKERLSVRLPAEASWEQDGGAAAWLQDGSAPLLRHLHAAESRMIELARNYAGGASDSVEGALRRAARELQTLQDGHLLREAADGARTALAHQRFHERWGRFDEACGLVESGLLAEAEPGEPGGGVDPRQGIDWRDYVPRGVRGTAEADVRELIRATSGRANIVMLAWEYPPKQVGGLACAVCDLAESLAAQGHVVHVVTTSHEGAPPLESARGVQVHRLPAMSSGPTDFYHWAFEWNLAIVDYLVRWKELGGRIDILHAHDWIVSHAARELKTSYGIPLVATIHATEWGRHQGRLHGDLQRSIHELERRLTQEALKVLVCSEYMRSEVMRLFELPAHKVEVFPNGIPLEEEETAPPIGIEEERRQWAEDGERIVFFIGRLVYEKGMQTLLEAMPSVWRQAPGTRLIVAGSGPMEDEWRRMSAGHGDRVRFVGFADKELKERLYRAADIVVIPSWYEPFGIVALEAIKFGKPLVISDTGGLAEIVEHGVDGFKALPGHAESLAWHIAELLRRPELGRRMAAKASEKLRERYAWPDIAAGIAVLYGELAPIG